MHTEAVLALTWADGLLISGSGDCLAKVTCWDEEEVGVSFRACSAWRHACCMLMALGEGRWVVCPLEGYPGKGRARSCLRACSASRSDPDRACATRTRQDSSSSSLEGWQLVAELCSHSQRVGALAVLEGHIATGSADDTIRIWDRARFECAATLKGHTDSVLVLAGFRASADSSPAILCSGSCDSTICVWSTESWQCIHRLTGHTGSVLALAVMPPSPRCASLRTCTRAARNAKRVLGMAGGAPRPAT